MASWKCDNLTLGRRQFALGATAVVATEILRSPTRLTILPPLVPKFIMDLPVFAITPLPIAGDLERFARMGIKALINNQGDDGEASTTPQSLEMGRAARAAGLSYSYQPIPKGPIEWYFLRDLDCTVHSVPTVACHENVEQIYLHWAADLALIHRRDIGALVAEAHNLGVDLRALHGVVDRLKDRWVSLR